MAYRRRKRNPEERYRAAERKYRQTKAFDDGITYLAEALRARDKSAVFHGWQPLHDMYVEHHMPGDDLGAEEVLITAGLTIGPSTNLCEGRTVTCYYSKPLIWDIMRGYVPGTTQELIDKISQELYKQGLVSEVPTLFLEQQHTVQPDFEVAAAKHPKYAIALFHSFIQPDPDFPFADRRPDHFLRVYWRRLNLPKLAQYEHSSMRGYLSVGFMLEDEPIYRHYDGPRVCITGVHTATGNTFTKRVSIAKFGVKKAVQIAVALAEKIYNAKGWQEVDLYSGTDDWLADEV